MVKPAGDSSGTATAQARPADPFDAVIRASYGSQGIAEDRSGQQHECVYRRSVGRPYCGDRVRLENTEQNTLVVAQIYPRRNEFARADRMQRKQVVATNLDRVLIVIAPQPAPSRDQAERYLVAVHSLGIEPVLVINKADLLSGEPPADTPFSRLDDYRRLGYAVVEVSCKGEPGVDGLQAYLQQATTILVGQSGVGKSSLANSLIPDLELQTGALSHSTGKGTHTTTTTIMYTLPSGGRLIDSPGVWEYGLWDMTADELAAGFIEFDPYRGQCRFHNCVHHTEPGCAVAAAAANGEILQWRYNSYLRLLQQST